MQSVPLYEHGERVLTPEGTPGRVIVPMVGPPVEFFDALDDDTIVRVVTVALESGEVRRYLATAIRPAA
ncbi:hypothetical protein ACFUTX_11555 [Microbacterium sp. NPDC057407]|uniref:hypothetical protein n=1 Tax=Microbacterium sp. NPDC057407 TaxID=3346120 RepID=UPI003670DA41